MKTIFLDVFDCPKEHAIYMIYILACIQHKSKHIMYCNCAKDMKHILQESGLAHTLCWTIPDQFDMHIVYNSYEQPQLWIPRVLEQLTMPQLQWKDVLKLLPKHDFITDLNQRAIDPKKTVIAVCIPNLPADHILWPSLTNCLTQIAETESFFLVLIKSPAQDTQLDLHAHHKRFTYTLNKELSHIEMAQLLSAVDVFIGHVGEYEHIAAVLRKPMLLIAPKQQRHWFKQGCRSDYIKLFPLIHHFSNDIKHMYLQFTELIYNWNLNIKTEEDELKHYYTLLDEPIAVYMPTHEAYTHWAESNPKFLDFIIPIIGKQSITNWVNKLQEYNIQTVIGDIPLWTKCMISLCVYQQHRSRIQWISHPPQADIPFEYWIHELHAFTRKPQVT